MRKLILCILSLAILWTHLDRYPTVAWLVLQPETQEEVLRGYLGYYFSKNPWCESATVKAENNEDSEWIDISAQCERIGI